MTGLGFPPDGRDAAPGRLSRMGIETIILVFGVVIAVGISVAVAKSRRKIHTMSGDSDPRVDPPAPPAGRPRA